MFNGVGVNQNLKIKARENSGFFGRPLTPHTAGVLIIPSLCKKVDRQFAQTLKKDFPEICALLPIDFSTCLWYTIIVKRGRTLRRGLENVSLTDVVKARRRKKFLKTS